MLLADFWTFRSIWNSEEDYMSYRNPIRPDEREAMKRFCCPHRDRENMSDSALKWILNINFSMRLCPVNLVSLVQYYITLSVIVDIDPAENLDRFLEIWSLLFWWLPWGQVAGDGCSLDGKRTWFLRFLLTLPSTREVCSCRMPRCLPTSATTREEPMWFCYLVICH